MFIDNAVYHLNHQAFLQIAGIDASKFLQGQLSCDVLKLSLTQSGIGSHSTAKGRMQSSFRICVNEPNSYLLRVHQSIAEKAHAALAKYIIFSKAKITHANEWVGIGLHGEKAQSLLASLFSDTPTEDYQQMTQDKLVMICTSKQLHSYEIYLHQEQAKSLWETLSQQLTACDASQHTLLENQLGLAFVDINTYEAFIPQMFNYQATPAISFKKGCYTGQEIVARMHYLGKIKRHMRHFSAQSNAELQTGIAVSTEQEGANIGDIVSAVKTGASNWDLLINITDDATNSTTLFTGIGTIDNLVTIELPYVLNE